MLAATKYILIYMVVSVKNTSMETFNRKKKELIAVSSIGSENVDSFYSSAPWAYLAFTFQYSPVIFKGLPDFLVCIVNLLTMLLLKEAAY